jgi:sugar/nucleoside kinase (ribokinase family)
MDTNNKKSILIIGAATLDRLLYVQEFPNADSKSSCKTQEGGGGNAANTATALGRLLRVRVTSDHHDNDNHDNEHDNDDIEQDDSDTSSTPTKQTCRVKVKLLTKISWDEIGNSLVKELHHDGIDLSSPLFLRSRGSSPVVTVIVTTMPPYTRTCLFDPGTVGTLMPNDLIIIRGGKKNDGNGIGLGNDHDNDNDHENGNDNDNDNDNEKARVVSDIMRQCIHLHSDTRHTEVALILAREASKQGVPMSVDVERDRRTREFDELVDLAGTVFTNEDLMKSIVLRRLGYDLFGVDVGGFGTVVGTHDGHGSATECNKLVESDDNDHAHGCFYCNVVKLCYFLTKRPAALVESNHHSQEECIDKELIVTRYVVFSFCWHTHARVLNVAC